ncbi:nitroreductase family protein [Falsihalocynthiibacter arcticus]|nr:nitroreductase [Falsihalocynthiibacter arcticus]
MTLDDIVRRRSVSPRRLIEPGPSLEQVRTMIDAACAAPDHRRLRPWRFILIRNDQRTMLANLFEVAARETHGTLSEDQTERAREKALNGACLIAVVGIIRDDVSDAPPHEQWVSVGAAVQNILLTATSFGFGSMIVSGDKVKTSALQKGLGLSAIEQFLGFVAVGTVSKQPAPADRPRAEDVFSVWGQVDL